jgi:mRNA-degrading endonuclease RelE of RelBE toxin-antitoxin system
MKTIYSKRFLKEAKNLRKKYRKIDDDLLKFVNALENDKWLGSARIEGFKGFAIYKTRVRNSSVEGGKSGGFRVIYYLKEVRSFHLLTIYSKSEKSDISRNEILAILSQENLFE